MLQYRNGWLSGCKRICRRAKSWDFKDDEDAGRLLSSGFFRMSKYSFLLLSLLSTALAIETSHRVSNLTVELACVVPACAEDCFLSFLQVNYGLERGSKIPSLEELCSTDGETGFTIGEGAVQCIAAEGRVGGCSNKNSDSSVIYKAYQMCSNEPNAIQPSHGVITATLVVPPSGGGPISYPSPAKTRTRSTRTGLPSTLVVDTHTLTFTTSSATDTTFITSVAGTTTQATGTSTSSGEPTSTSAAAASSSLSPVQKAGISVGVIGFAVIAVGFLLLFRLYRARKKRGEHTPLSSTPPRRDSWGYRFDKRRGGGGEPAWMANPVHPPNDSNHGSGAAPAAVAAITLGTTATATATTPKAPSKSPAPKAYNRTSWRPSLIGLAISPSHSKHTTHTPTAPRPISKLLPAKPILSLNIPKKPPTPPTKHASPPTRNNMSETPSPTYTRVASQPPVLPKLLIPPREDFLYVPKSTNKPRESTMTEFEEDGRESSSISPQGQIWRPPSAAPQSAFATYYVADKYGNWVLADPKRASQTAELEGVTPLSAYPKLATSMTILPIVNSNRAEESSTKRPVHRRSSSAPTQPPPAQQSIRVVTEPLMKLQDAQQHVVPRALFSGTGNPRNSASAKRSSGRSLTRPRAPSADSGITTISTSSEDETELPQPRTSQVNLSPVAESPRSGNGRSPVSYPKIPGRENGPTGKARLVPPPRMPILYKSAHHRTASGGIASSVSVPMLQPVLNPGPNTVKEMNTLQDEVVTPTGSLIKPIIPTTTVTTASPLQVLSMPRAPKPLQDPALLRTGSPTMRIVQPSPEPEDDRSTLPSARPRNTQIIEQPPKPQTQLQPSPFPSNPSQNQQEYMGIARIPQPQLEQVRQLTEHQQRLDIQNAPTAPVQQKQYLHPQQVKSQLQPQYQKEVRPQAPEQQRQQPQVQIQEPQVVQNPQAQLPTEQHQRQQPKVQIQTPPVAPHQQNPQPQPQFQHDSEKEVLPQQNQHHHQPEAPFRREIRPQRDQRQQQHQQQRQEHQQPQTQHPRRPDAPNWIPGLPAHPHPQRRPQHTSTLWLPPQARKGNPQNAPRVMETEPHHHQLSPMRPLKRGQQQEYQTQARTQGQSQQQQHHGQPQAQVQSQLQQHQGPQQAQIQNQPQSAEQAHHLPNIDRQVQFHPHLPQDELLHEIHPLRVRPQPQPTQPQPHQQPPHVRRPQQHAYPYPNPRPHPSQQPRHYPQFHPQQRQSQNQPPRQQQGQPPQSHFQQPSHQEDLSQLQPPASLIAKRLGHDRAVNMSISTNPSSSSGSNNWHRGSGGPMYLSPEVITPGGYPGDLPSTPTWLPRLTPTRRGADLYLNVQ